MKNAQGCAAVVLGLALTTAVAGPHASGDQAPDPKQVAAGKKLLTDKDCVKCHSAEGKGNKKLPLDGVAAKLSPDDIRKWLTAPAEMTAKLAKKPKVAMKKQDLAPAEVDQLVAYMLTLK